MAVEKARAHLEQWNRGADVIEFEASTATVDEAAAALETEPEFPRRGERHAYCHGRGRQG